LPAWTVRPPLLPTRPELVEKALQELAEIEC